MKRHAANHEANAAQPDRLPVDAAYNATGFEILKTHDMGPLTEDGERYLVEVYDLEVRTLDGRRWVFHLAFRSQDEAKRFATDVIAFGTINPEKWNCAFDPNAAQELPDYVTDWYRPEFN